MDQFDILCTLLEKPFSQQSVCVLAIVKLPIGNDALLEGHSPIVYHFYSNLI